MSRKVKVVQLLSGLDLVGSKLSFAASRNIELTELPHGVQVYSRGSNRTIVIPYSNLKGYECFPPEASTEAPKSAPTTKTTKAA